MIIYRKARKIIERNRAMVKATFDIRKFYEKGM